MKCVVAFLAVLAVMSFKPGTEKDIARVTKYQGMYVFMQSQPLADYKVLGTVKKTGLVWSTKPKEMYNTLCRRALKDYSDAEGIIFDDVEMEHATVIKFK